MESNMKIKTPLYFILLLTMLTLMSGCSHGYPGNSNGKSEPLKTVTLTESGGITGAVKGYTFYSYGTVEYWEQQAGQTKTVKKTYTADQKKIQKLFSSFDQKILAFNHNQTGNMTTTIMLTTPNDSYKWSWSGGGHMANIPTELSPIYQQLEKTISNL